LKIFSLYPTLYVSSAPYSQVLDPLVLTVEPVCHNLTGLRLLFVTYCG